MSITARDITTGLGGKWTGRTGMARCPAHDDKTPSLSIAQTRDGRPLVFCHAGCKGEDVIGALKSRGLWPEREGAIRDPSYLQGFTYRHDGIDGADERKRRDEARMLWDRALPAAGTLAEIYLRSRGIRVPVPECLRFLPRLEHYPSKKYWPCMIAAIQLNGAVLAVQRTYLDPLGAGKAPVEGAKRSLGPMGQGAVCLGPAMSMLGLAEGIETALSARQLYGFPVWATLSANRLAKITLPKEVTNLTIFADDGDVGMKAAFEAAEVYERCGLSVDVMPPRVHFGARFDDFNSVVREKAASCT